MKISMKRLLLPVLLLLAVTGVASAAFLGDLFTSPDPLFFPGTVVGTASAPDIVILGLAGSTEVIVDPTAIVVTTGAYGDFNVIGVEHFDISAGTTTDVTGNPSVTMGPGDEVRFSAQFAPLSPVCGNGIVDTSGTHTANLEITTDIGVIATGLSGAATGFSFETCDDGNLIPGDGCDEFCQIEVAPGNFQITPSPHNFGSVTVGGTPASQIFTFEILSSTNGIEWTDAVLGGPNAADFTITAEPPAFDFLVQGETRTITVEFDPLSAGSKSAILQAVVFSLDTFNQEFVDVQLSGTAQAGNFCGDGTCFAPPEDANNCPADCAPGDGCSASGPACSVQDCAPGLSCQFTGGGGGTGCFCLPIPPTCGDGTVNQPSEQCDGADLAGNSCTTVPGGFSAGTLGCTPTCTFDTSSCVSAVVQFSSVTGSPGDSANVFVDFLTQVGAAVLVIPFDPTNWIPDPTTPVVAAPGINEIDTEKVCSNDALNDCSTPALGTACTTGGGTCELTIALTHQDGFGTGSTIGQQVLTLQGSIASTALPGIFPGHYAATTLAVTNLANTVLAPALQVPGNKEVQDCIDLDGDGYGAAGSTPGFCPNGDDLDCEDSNSDIHPGQTDVCDGIDNDCDVSVDEDFTFQTTTCGVGACNAAGATSCVGGIVVDSCTPGNAAADDSTCNGVDDDCDGQTDENYVSQTTSCGIGACGSTGSTSCVNGVEEDSCTPGTAASNDATCDGVDDDCDGTNDEDYMSMVTNCGVGACAATGVTSCVSGAVQNSCTPGTPATDDSVCNGVDDDCDGQTDEDYVETSTTCGVGACQATGTLICDNGVPTDTCTEGAPGTGSDLCDGIDNDCDGQTDEDHVDAPTSCGIGACGSTGSEVCVNGAIEDTCTPGTAASNDATCDGVDDDCDGQTDEDYLSSPTSCGVGVCAASGQNICVSGAIQDTCAPGTPTEGTDVTCDGLDGDCDGSVDEEYNPVSTTCGVGACQATGVTACVGGLETDSCLPGTPGANDATCDGLDNDCDGSIDEEYVSTITSCGIGACEASGATTCIGGIEGDTCSPGAPASNDATCNGVDDDCDGQTDENYVSQTTSCGIGACGSTGSTSCVNGVEEDSCTPGIPAADDSVCDGIDNDCDASVDEDFVSTPTSCGVGGCASTGATTCTAGTLGDSCTPGTPVPEVCDDGVDNDCDVDVDCDDTLSCSADPACLDCIDGDGDGYGLNGGTSCPNPGADCNDGDNQINPGAAEVCDFIDNDCDGIVDDGFDLDGDGFTTCGGDCDDGNPNVNPGAAEVCDGFDNNCDGVIPENEVDEDGDGFFICDGDCNDVPAGGDATLIIHSLQVANSGSGADMAADVFLQSGPVAPTAGIGGPEFVIPLTSGGNFIEDVPFTGAIDDVPGIYVTRIEDPIKGPSVIVSAYGFNPSSTREVVVGEFRLDGATVDGVKNGPRGPYEKQGDGICKSSLSMPADAKPGQDEYTIAIGDTEGTFCSITNVHRDVFTVYLGIDEQVDGSLFYPGAPDEVCDGFDFDCDGTVATTPADDILLVKSEHVHYDTSKFYELDANDDWDKIAKFTDDQLIIKNNEIGIGRVIPSQNSIDSGEPDTQDQLIVKQKTPAGNAVTWFYEWTGTDWVLEHTASNDGVIVNGNQETAVCDIDGDGVDELVQITEGFNPDLTVYEWDDGLDQWTLDFTGTAPKLKSADLACGDFFGTGDQVLYKKRNKRETFVHDLVGTDLVQVQTLDNDKLKHGHAEIAAGNLLGGTSVFVDPDDNPDGDAFICEEDLCPDVAGPVNGCPGAITTTANIYKKGSFHHDDDDDDDRHQAIYARENQEVIVVDKVCADQVLTEMFGTDWDTLVSEAFTHKKDELDAISEPSLRDSGVTTEDCVVDICFTDETGTCTAAVDHVGEYVVYGPYPSTVGVPHEEIVEYKKCRGWGRHRDCQEYSKIKTVFDKEQFDYLVYSDGVVVNSNLQTAHLDTIKTGWGKETPAIFQGTIVGSELMVIPSQYLIETSADEKAEYNGADFIYPIILEAEEPWEVSFNIQPPEGYDIVYQSEPTVDEPLEIMIVGLTQSVGAGGTGAAVSGLVAGDEPATESNSFGFSLEAKHPGDTQFKTQSVRTRTTLAPKAPLFSGVGSVVLIAGLTAALVFGLILFVRKRLGLTN